MKLVYAMGALLLLGTVFLALGAPAASARSEDATPAENAANATPGPMAPPVATPTDVTPTPNLNPAPVPTPRAINPDPWPVPITGEPTGIRPWGSVFRLPRAPVTPEPIDPNPSFTPIPKDVLPTPLFDVA